MGEVAFGERARPSIDALLSRHDAVRPAFWHSCRTAPCPAALQADLACGHGNSGADLGGVRRSFCREFCRSAAPADPEAMRDTRAVPACPPPLLRSRASPAGLLPGGDCIHIALEVLSRARQHAGQECVGRLNGLNDGGVTQGAAVTQLQEQAGAGARLNTVGRPQG